MQHLGENLYAIEKNHRVAETTAVCPCFAYLLNPSTRRAGEVFFADREREGERGVGVGVVVVVMGMVVVVVVGIVVGESNGESTSMPCPGRGILYIVRATSSCA